MNKNEFTRRLAESFLILDGATGTELQKLGMPVGVCPEKWVLEHPQAIIDIQKGYEAAGSNVVYTCTFGANRLKLAEYGYGGQALEWNEKIAHLSRQAVGEATLVAGNISSIGQFIRPFGEFPFEAAVEIFKEQVTGLIRGGVDFLVIETMIDIQEARAALLAVKESCDLPVCVSMTFDEDGRTLMGTTPLVALLTLQSLGADVVGCNCSTGPETMAGFIKEMKAYAKVPLLAKPNAGMPRLIDGRTVFDMNAEEFGRQIRMLAESGANLIGGCCGTAPEYIKELTSQLQGMRPQGWLEQGNSVVTSARQAVFVGPDYPVTLVGERINPTGKKVLQAELREGRLGEVRRLALDQLAAGAEILDVNVGMSGIDEQATMIKVVEVLAAQVETPLCLDSAAPEVLEAALRVYPGRALVNSVSAERQKIEELLPIVAKYGALFIILPLNEQGIPPKAEARIELIKQVEQAAQSYGYSRSELVVDGLVMTVSAEQQAARETLQVIKWAAENGFNSIVGLSNISFGLPQRNWINGAFLVMAIANGLTMAIANPSMELMMNLKYAADVLTVKDKHSLAYIERFKDQPSVETVNREPEQALDLPGRIRQAVVIGATESIGELLNAALAAGATPQALINEEMIPAITYVGELFEKKQYFLPQLIQSAETMKTGFEVLEPYLENNQSNLAEAKVKIVLATVKGDIHDIGKNIVALMFRNYGFQVYDLGKDVSAEAIIAAVVEHEAQLVGLSALMTTTMTEMPKVIQLAKEKGLDCKFMIGGAAVDANYAKEIGADGYSADAHQAVKLARRLSGMDNEAN